MSTDPIVAEIHAIRERLAARFNYDIHAIGDYARELEAHSGREVVSRPPRRPEGWQDPAAESAVDIAPCKKSNRVSMSRAIWVFGHADKSENAFPKPADLVKYMKNGVFTDNNCRYRYTLARDADIIIMSRDGLAYGHFNVSCREEPTDEDKNDYPPVKAVYIVVGSSVYSTPVRLSEIDISGIQFGK